MGMALHEKLVVWLNGVWMSALAEPSRHRSGHGAQEEGEGARLGLEGTRVVRIRDRRMRACDIRGDGSVAMWGAFA